MDRRFAKISRRCSKPERETRGAPFWKAPMPALHRSLQWRKRRTILITSRAALSSRWKAWCNPPPPHVSAAHQPAIQLQRKPSAKERGRLLRTGALRKSGSMRWLLVARSADRRRKAESATKLPCAVTDHVASAPHRVQQRLGEALVDFRSQPRNVHVDHIGLRIEMVVPDVFQQHRPR